MVTMRMGDDCLWHWLPWINIKLSLRAAKAFVCKLDQRHLVGFLIINLKHSCQTVLATDFHGYKRSMPAGIQKRICVNLCNLWQKSGANTNPKVQARVKVHNNLQSP